MSRGAAHPRRTKLTRTRAYLGYYPRDIAFAGTVAATLRSAGDVPSALHRLPSQSALPAEPKRRRDRIGADDLNR